MADAAVPRRVWLLGAPAALPAALLPWLRLRHADQEWCALTDVPADGDPVCTGAAAAEAAVLISREPLAPADLAVENRLRLWLQARGWPYAVLYWPIPGGPGDSVAVLAARLAERLGLVTAPPAAEPPVRQPWHPLGGCEACSDPACEHRLFQDLLARRSVQT